MTYYEIVRMVAKACIEGQNITRAGTSRSIRIQCVILPSCRLRTIAFTWLLSIHPT